MKTPRLKSLLLENFRSLRGNVVIPLDAQVVLIHGTNGMGKTSILSAIELALSGRISHLAANGDNYRSHLVNVDSSSGSITLTTTAALPGASRTSGVLTFSESSIDATPLLESEDCHHFSDRCYLPQATLGRLLEIYGTRKTNKTSPLTLFVKELLGLDPLDALVDGLHPALNVTRVRHLIPEYRHFEELRTSLQGEMDRLNRRLEITLDLSNDRLSKLEEILAALLDDPSASQDRAGLIRQRDLIKNDKSIYGRRDAINRLRLALQTARNYWRSLSVNDPNRNRADEERRAQDATQALEAWRAGAGKELGEVLSDVWKDATERNLRYGDPEEHRIAALFHAELELAVCERRFSEGKAFREKTAALDDTFASATARIEELDKQIISKSRDAKSIANALAGISPHLEGDTCPVCDRDFSEVASESLAAHIAAKVAALTSEAGHLQALATERAEQSAHINALQNARLSLEYLKVSPSDAAELAILQVGMSNAIDVLRKLEPVAHEGRRLQRELEDARNSLGSLDSHHEYTTSLLLEIESHVKAALGRSTSSYPTVEQAIDEALEATDAEIGRVEDRVSLRSNALIQIDVRMNDLAEIEDLQEERARLLIRLAIANSAAEEVEMSRELAKKVSNTASNVRSQIVKSVLNTSLNKTWRELFVRLAPSEQFVPAFSVTNDDGGKVDAILETLHRSGKIAGPPGAMLSQGNLNTAALTLFLALNLSAPMRMPWLILDDPVQSMDDLHIAQFSALLRTLSKRMDRQIIIAVHERALFEYLTLELSPSFAGDSLISIEITRNFSGEAVATPRSFSFEEDHVVAA